MSADDHRRAAELLPWLVNGRLQGEELRWLNAHVGQCRHCSAEVQAQRRVREALAGDTALEFAPLAGYHRLWDRIVADCTPLPAARPQLPSLRRRGWPLLVAGLVAAQALAIVALALALWQARATPQPAYRTVTAPPPATVATDSSLLVTVDDRTTLAEFRELLHRAGLRVHDGPTASGVYVLAADSLLAPRSIEQALQQLRAAPQVHFAERGADSAEP